MAVDQEAVDVARGLQVWQVRNQSLVNVQSVCEILVATREPSYVVESTEAQTWRTRQQGRAEDRESGTQCQPAPTILPCVSIVSRVLRFRCIPLGAC